MANLFDMKGGKMLAVLSKIAERLPPEVGDAILDEDPNALNEIVSAVMNIPRFTLVHGRFNKLEAQLKRVRELNLERNWGISIGSFDTVERFMPEWPKDKLVAVTLVPYLADVKDDKGKIIMSGIERTFHELWEVAASQQLANSRWDGFDKAGPDKLRLLKGIEHPLTSSGSSTLRWEVIDLGCNCNKKPMDIRNPEQSPHAGILASAMLHPEWIKAMDVDKVPNVWIPGYEVNIFSEDEGPWQGVPNLSFDRDDRRIKLLCGWYDGCCSSWAVPSFVKPALAA